jgi:hypothetical protein
MDFCASLETLRIFFATPTGNVAQQHAQVLGDAAGNSHNHREITARPRLALDLLKGAGT